MPFFRQSFGKRKEPLRTWSIIEVIVPDSPDNEAVKCLAGGQVCKHIIERFSGRIAPNIMSRRYRIKSKIVVPTALQRP